MEKKEVKLSAVYRIINPGCVTLVSVGDGEQDNIFSLTWNTPVRKDPPLLAMVSGKGHFSYPFIERTGEFGLNIPDDSIADAVLGCGTTTGRKVPDKFARFGLHREAAREIQPPLVAEAVASLECRVQEVVDLGKSAIIVAQVLRAVASAEHFRDGQWAFDRGLRLLHHLSGSRFCVSDKQITAKRAGADQDK